MNERALHVPAKGDLSPEARKALKGLANDRQRAFVWEYLIDYNATQAAIRAGYSKDTAKVQGSRLLTNVAVSRALRELGKVQIEHAIETTRGTVADRHEVLARDTAISRSSPFDFIQPITPGSKMMVLTPPDQLSQQQLEAVRRVKLSENGIVAEIEVESKHNSLQRLAQHHRIIGSGSYIGDESNSSDDDELEDWQEAHLTAQWLRETAARVGTDSIDVLASKLEEAGPETDANEVEAEYADIVEGDE